MAGQSWRVVGGALGISSPRNEAEKLLKLGLSHQSNGRLREAEEKFQAAVEIDPTCEGAWLSLGMVQQDQH
ncbi:MAG: tetratricopeptide repeat protein, partial [Promethearchaeota archaeon]